jgi:HD-GYP domain-containing protein (c-di-GMP phosphodiesterase class II)
MQWRSADELFAKGGGGNEPAVLLMDASMLARIDDVRRLPRYVAVVAADAPTANELGERAHASLVGIQDVAKRTSVLRKAGKFSEARLTARRQRRQLARARLEIHELKRISIALSNERSLSVLLAEILKLGKGLTQSDGGALLLRETDEHDTPVLRLALYRADSLPDLPPLGHLSVPMDNSSIVGHAAVTRMPINIADANNLPPDAGFTRNATFDWIADYHVQSMLVVPMVDHREHVVGVLVLINRKANRGAVIRNKEDADRYVLRYTGRQMRLARALASAAAVAIENTWLYERIEYMLESFVKASVSAIDQRDPSTAGHSVRVAMLTLDLASAVESEHRGLYADTQFTREQMRELKFAALLHDFGKIAVREEVLLKAKKLPPVLWVQLESRFDLIRSGFEVEYYKQRAHLLRSRKGTPQRLARLEREFVERRDQLDHVRDVVRAANEPDSLNVPLGSELSDIAKLTHVQPDHTVVPYLTSEEMHFLQIPLGTLDEQERGQIQSHAEQTHRFLEQIPWTDDLKNMATYAYEHHEKLNGTGYPRKLHGSEIPVQSRILAIADIFDALTESDRPYRRAVTAESALDILQSDAMAGQLDRELVRIMIDSECYRRVLEEDWRNF